MTNGFCNPQYFASIEGDVPMKGDVIYYSQNSTVGSIVKMTDAIIVDKFVILYVGTIKGRIGKVSKAGRQAYVFFLNKHVVPKRP